MRDAADFVDEAQLTDVLADGWGVRVSDLVYLPEGGGAYHWVATTTDDQRVFITCDDLRTKPWLGDRDDVVFAALSASYRRAMALRTLGRLSFVCAPVPSTGGDVVVRLDASHTVAVLPYVDGHPGTWGRPADRDWRGRLVRMLAAVHDASFDVDADVLPTPGLVVADRAALDEALLDLGGPWEHGPLSEQARSALATHATQVHAWLDALDAHRLESAAAVLTHGEPHPGNLMLSGQGLVLLDWDTLAVAPPERDMWMLHDRSGAAADGYAALTGRRLDLRALSAYRLLWALSDLAAFTLRLRRPHRAGGDAARALDGLRSILAGTEPAPWG